MQERKRHDSPQRSTQLRRNADENDLVSHAAQFLQSRKRSEEDNIFSDSEIKISQELVTKFTRHKPQVYVVLRREIDRVRHTEIIWWNSRAEVKFLARQISQNLWKRDNYF